MISVIMPIYHNIHLEECLESLKNQTYTDYELIAVVKPCEDRCEEIVAKYFPNAIIVLDEGNVSVARNIGLDDASGDYIAFLNSTDVWDKTYLEEMSKHLGGEFLYSCCKTRSDAHDFFELCDKENRYCHLTSGIIVKKNSIRFDESMFIGEDIKYFSDVASLGGNFHLNADLVMYRKPAWDKYLCVELEVPVQDSKEKYKHRFYLRWCLNTGLKNLASGFKEKGREQLKPVGLGFLARVPTNVMLNVYHVLMENRKS